MQQLANGNYEVAVHGTDRRDEVGDVAKTALVFKDNGLAKIRMEREQKDAEARAAAHETQMHPLQQPQRLRVEAQRVACLVKRVDPCEQRFVQRDGRGMAREAGRHGALHRLQGVVGIGAGQCMEGGRYAPQQGAGALHGRDGVVEAGRGVRIGAG